MTVHILFLRQELIYFQKICFSQILTYKDGYVVLYGVTELKLNTLEIRKGNCILAFNPLTF